MLLTLSRVASSGERTGEDAVEALRVLGDWGSRSVLMERAFGGFWSLPLMFSENGLVALKIVSLPTLTDTFFPEPLGAMLDETSEVRDLNDIGDGKGL